MKINNIELFNFGPYESSAYFDTHTSSQKNIILIGGKNGSGKTTLFTAMKVCLYGYMGMGYKNANSRYYENVKKMINNSSKIKENPEAYIKMELEIDNRRDKDIYILKRSWEIKNGVKEKLLILKNDINLTGEEVNDFEKFLVSYVPPELFNLYFFDGERIADFFLENDNKKNIKKAFSIICGYDVFEIAKRQFNKYAIQNKDKSNITFKNYNTKKEECETLNSKLKNLEEKIEENNNQLDYLEAEIKKIDISFKKKGGLSFEEYNSKIASLKLEEKRREGLNNSVKEAANNIVPFLILKDNLIRLKEKIVTENNDIKYENFIDILDSFFLNHKDIDQNTLFTMKNCIEHIKNNKKRIFNLSIEQTSDIFYKINCILSYDKTNLSAIKNEIKTSLKESAKIRKEIENTDMSIYDAYINKRATLLEKKSKLIENKYKFDEEYSSLLEIKKKVEKDFYKAKDQLEENIKKKSIKNISARSLLMIEDLEKKLYENQIEKFRTYFIGIINKMMRKNQFIDDIEIDDNFNIIIYKFKNLELKELISVFESDSEEKVISKIGKKAYEVIMEKMKNHNRNEVIDILLKSDVKTISIPFEIDIDTISNGEKQIFIMALYYSLVKLADRKIPFIIDTPFARIDNEHRNNICEYFFKDLSGQIFIFSTDEEISEENYGILKENIAKTYILENSDNLNTTVINNRYFEL